MKTARRDKRRTTAFIVKEKLVVCRRCGEIAEPGDRSRGLHIACYQSVHRHVANETFTWDELEKRGKVARTRPTTKDWLAS